MMTDTFGASIHFTLSELFGGHTSPYIFINSYMVSIAQSAFLCKGFGGARARWPGGVRLWQNTQKAQNGFVQNFLKTDGFSE